MIEELGHQPSLSELSKARVIVVPTSDQLARDIAPLAVRRLDLNPTLRNRRKHDHKVIG